jgi:hypothetical protein
MKPKTKKLVLGAGVLAGGLYALAKLPQTKDTPLGTAGSIVASPVDSLLGTSTDSDATPATPTETIGGLLESLPFYDVSAGGWGSSPPSIPLIGSPDISPVTTSKKRSSIVSGAVSATSLIPKIGTYTIMKPVQILGGGIGAPIGASIARAVGRTPAHQRRTRTVTAPRTSHAVSMLTGGATARAPVTKKQVAAREKYPTTYKVWKGLFGWLGA